MLTYIKSLFGTKRTSNPSKRRKQPIAYHPTATIIPRTQHTVSKTDISRNALKVLNRIDAAGFEAYLVGGGVRDLLLHKSPKDFDIATNAHPQQVRKLFRNCRLIGKRFRLAHILFGREIIEVATFRAASQEDDHEHRHIKEGMLLRDNVYGTMEEDVWRRDLTVNALYYNIADFSIVDFVGGMEDIQAKQIRTIGDPETRFKEDPVRMLRTIRFANKLNFTIAPDTQAPIQSLAPLLNRIPPARRFEEVLKLFQRGLAEKNYHLLRKHHLFRQLFPLTHEAFKQNETPSIIKLIEQTLKNTDERIAQDKPVNPAFLLAVFLWHPLLIQAKRNEVKKEIPPLPALEQAMTEIIQKQSLATSIPKRLSKVMREMWLLQYRLPRRYGKRPYILLEHPRFRAAYDFLLLRAQAGEVETELAQWWTNFQTASNNEREDMINACRKPKQPKRKKQKPKQKPKTS